ncbi:MULTISPECIES: NAD(P)/FAD-dependent oxidoreductase [unclassified Enterococcus]|uniref:NAD(P)/FAD-dependent oxidoreductase n=1 Tax=unclassified Enterococcus TaxID=2608891 RepID=UPI001552ECD9|nr:MULTISPECIES: NAD(P)/FAD-dependent oxidoreductase [unclassified Enterococcus]MBS7576646.1 NAD(P)/FAD-dependent oxidoreductase [Enterococcus sp. MMGLQ5-2]MBS7583867.1 NAD(P)/FAD-dependent oxidoreductase [Enterococcus sp. MMGLQ5-1]NPD11728.1 NAD(P)/FAD-dependent oxidoreductase [Enterococcus sp. MMGLQ5-1]NPD36483.1 NAD(P)/FAD-dependent oxidoreductase [Enterococcus sp. MMGLQ5-2]
MNEIYDITVIGGGPVGIYAAYYGRLRSASVKLIESLGALGGQVAAFYPEKFIHDLPGFKKIKASDFINDLVEQMNDKAPAVCLNETVEAYYKLENNIFEIVTNKGKHYSKSIILAIGKGAFEPRRLELPDSTSYEGRSLRYYVNDIKALTNQNVVILGGGNSAVDWALMLEEIASSVSLIHRRDKFRAHESSLERLFASSVKLYTPYQISQLIGTDGQLNEVEIQNTKSKAHETIALDQLIVNYGFLSDLGPIDQWGLDLTKRKKVKVNPDMMSSVSGIFALGDACDYDGKLDFIITGFGDVPMTVNNALQHAYPEEKIVAKHFSASE